ALALVTTLPAHAVTEALKPTSTQSITTIDIIDKLSKRHYRNLVLDDALSEAFLNGYLDSLDPGRLYLLQSDVQKFEADKKKHDDYLKKGNLQPGFDIYHTYRQRVSTRLEWILARLEDPELKFDFTVKEAV